MDVNATEANDFEFIPMHEACASLNCSARTLMRLLSTHGLPLVKLSRVNRGVRRGDMRLLIDSNLEQVA